MKALALLNRAIVVLSAVALLVASCVLTYSVVLRYFSPQPTDWQDEFSVFLLIGVTFMSAAWVQSQRGHIGIEAVAHLLPPSLDRLRLRAVDAASALFCAFFAWNHGHCCTRPGSTAMSVPRHGRRRCGFPI